MPREKAPDFTETIPGVIELLNQMAEVQEKLANANAEIQRRENVAKTPASPKLKPAPPPYPRPKKDPAIKTGNAALMACGMQPEFASHVMLMQQGFQTSIVFRAGNPPIYDRPRAPKSGLNLSKTSNQGFFKGTIPENDTLFSRLEEISQEINGQKKATQVPRKHDEKDKKRLKDNAQHTTVLPIRLRDMIRELDKDGDLIMLPFTSGDTQMRFEYKKGKGPPGFKGEFIINLDQGNKFISRESRAWDKQKDPKVKIEEDGSTKVIKPHGFNMTDDVWGSFYEQFKHTEFPLQYKVNKDDPNEMPKKAKVFSDDNNLIIAGDWDGLALGHPPNLPPYATKVYNTFKYPEDRKSLLNATIKLLAHLKKEILKKENIKPPITLTPYEKALKQITFDKNLYSDFSLERAGCITPFEFLNNSVANYLYKEKQHNLLREPAHQKALEHAFTSGIEKARKYLIDSQKATTGGRNKNERTQHRSRKRPIPPLKEVIDVAMHKAKQDLKNDPEKLEYVEHMLTQEIAEDYRQFSNASTFQRPVPNILHPDYDPNIKDLFQHGFDMRNPYGCNLDGAWLLISHSGHIIHGKTEEQLIQVLLTGDFLEKNYFDVNPLAKMEKGWAKVIEKQIDFGQKNKISPNTMKSYLDYKKQIDPQSSKVVQKESLPQKFAQRVGLYNHKKPMQPLPSTEKDNTPAKKYTPLTPKKH